MILKSTKMAQNNLSKSPKLSPVNIEYGKMPPQAIDMEEAVLGAIMLEKDAVVAVLDLLRHESFYKEAHQKIFSAIIDLSTQLQPIDILTVTEELKKRGELDIIGGPLIALNIFW